VASAVLDPRRRRALALLCGALFMVLLDGVITIAALPRPKSVNELPEPDPAAGAAAAADVVIRSGTKCANSAPILTTHVACGAS
jgi:hypothetical protein